MTSGPGEAQDDPQQEPALPAAVNLPLLAEDVTFDISIKRSALEERVATLEEKRATLTEKATASREKRNRRLLVLVVLFAVLGLCLYEIFFAPINEGRRQFAEKLSLATVAFAVGNAVPSLLKEEGEGKEK